jgi:hypothetical protein
MTTSGKLPRAVPVSPPVRRAVPCSDYRIVSGDTPEEVRAGVLALIDEGWEPAGGLCSSPARVIGMPDFYQAMVLRTA